MGEKAAVYPDLPVGEALKAVARDVLAEARAALDHDKSDAIAVHDYRKAMKRWRALLRLLEPFLGDEGRRLRIAARNFARELAGARDAQAAMEALEDIAEEPQTVLSPRSLVTIRTRLDALRKSAEAASVTQAMRARLIVALDELAPAIDTWALDKLTFGELAGELTRTYRRMRKDAPREDWRSVPPEVLHDLRRRVVAHRYQMELVEPLWPKFGRVWVAEAQRLRDRLGAHQDLSMLLAFTAPHQPLAPWRARLTPLIAERQAAHAKASSRIAGRMLAEKPRAFRRRIEALWKAEQR
jgi:CHAD domain-containing protein